MNVNSVDYGTFKKLLNTKIEPNFVGSIEFNAEEITILEPFDKVYHRIVSVMKQSTQEYYNMRILLGFKCA